MIDDWRAGKGLAKVRSLWRLLSGLLSGFILLAAAVACGPTGIATPVATEESTLVPTVAPTETPTQTPWILGTFSAQMEGVLPGAETHGTKACITYDGDAADLDNLVLTAKFTRGTRIIERGIPAEQVGEKTCFEMVDARYVSVNPDDGTLIIPDTAIKLEINATSPDGRAIQNNNQTIDLGKYVQFPFLRWIYETQKVCRANEHVEYLAWDFVPYPTSESPTVVNTPILSPAEGYIYTMMGNNTQTGLNYSVMVYSPTTGYLIDFTHNANIFVTSEGNILPLPNQNGKFIMASDIIAMIGPKDSDSGMPHTHMEIKIPSPGFDMSLDASELSSIFWNNILDHNNKNIDFIKSNLFLDGGVNSYLSNLPNNASACGNFTWGTLLAPPQQLPFTIDGNASDWTGYSPVLTDASGDSQAGNVMDFTELYTAKDDNYLYIMLKAGNKPSSEWAINFYLDTSPGNQCEAADRVLEIWSQRPDAFTINSLNGCENVNDTEVYSTQFRWGNVLEIKIPLYVLGNTENLSIVKLLGLNQNGSDTMP